MTGCLCLWKRACAWEERTYAEEYDSVLGVSVGELKETEKCYKNHWLHLCFSTFSNWKEQKSLTTWPFIFIQHPSTLKKKEREKYKHCSNRQAYQAGNLDFEKIHEGHSESANQRKETIYYFSISIYYNYPEWEWPKYNIKSLLFSMI